MKIVVLDGYNISQEDLNWNQLKELGALEWYDRCPDEEIIRRIGDAQSFFVSKNYIGRDIMEACPNLKFIGATATGYDNIDVKSARDLGIAVCNVPAYSTDAVAQHAIALLLELTNQVGLHNRAIQEGEWLSADDYCFWKSPILLLSGKSLGIIGYGSIGKKTGEIAKAFGMTINVYSQNKKAALQSDFISLHCPSTPENVGFVNSDLISQMKDGVILINTARGALINESDLGSALRSGKVAAAALDVLASEPPEASNPLIGLSNCYLTPHIAWLPKEMRQAVIDICADNLRSFLSGGSLNRVE